MCLLLVPALKSNLLGGEEVGPSVGEVARMRACVLAPTTRPTKVKKQTDTHITGSRAWQLDFGLPSPPEWGEIKNCLSQPTCDLS